MNRHKTTKIAPDTLRQSEKHFSHKCLTNSPILNQRQRYLTPTVLVSQERFLKFPQQIKIDPRLSIVKLLQKRSTTKLVPKFRQLELVGKNFGNNTKSYSKLYVGAMKHELFTKNETIRAKLKKATNVVPSHIIKVSSAAFLRKAEVEGLKRSFKKSNKKEEEKVTLDVQASLGHSEKNSLSINGWEEM